MADDGFAAALGRQLHKAPHGTELPASMPYIGDIFMKEEPDGTATLYVWEGRWCKGVEGFKKMDDGRYFPSSPR